MDFKEKLKGLALTDKRIKIFVAIAFVGILLIALSDFIPHSNHQAKVDDLKASYTTDLENETEKLLSSVNGVGKCKVMITIKSTNETVYAQNSDVSQNNGNYSKKYEYVFYDGSNGDEPILIKQYMPQVQGVAVVCEGGDNPKVIQSVIAAISSLFDISSSKISISKLG